MAPQDYITLFLTLFFSILCSPTPQHFFLFQGFFVFSFHWWFPRKVSKTNKGFLSYINIFQCIINTSMFSFPPFLFPLFSYKIQIHVPSLSTPLPLISQLAKNVFSLSKSAIKYSHVMHDKTREEKKAIFFSKGKTKYQIFLC